MRTMFSRTFFAGVALVALATGAAAQDRTALLTSIEVKELVARAQPDDHARSRDHFGALAGRYTVDAQRHKAMAQVLTGNPNHPPAVSPGVHHMRLADAAIQSATTARELSAHHGRLAAGQTSQAPANSARLRMARARRRRPTRSSVSCRPVRVLPPITGFSKSTLAGSPRSTPETRGDTTRWREAIEATRTTDQEVLLPWPSTARGLRSPRANPPTRPSLPRPNTGTPRRPANGVALTKAGPTCTRVGPVRIKPLQRNAASGPARPDS